MASRLRPPHGWAGRAYPHLRPRGDPRMTTSPLSPAAVAVPADVAYADGMLSARAVSSAVFLAGLLAGAGVGAVGRAGELARGRVPPGGPAGGGGGRGR